MFVLHCRIDTMINNQRNEGINSFIYNSASFFIGVIVTKYVYIQIITLIIIPHCKIFNEQDLLPFFTFTLLRVLC